MDFIKADEIRNLLSDYGIEQDNTDENHVYLRMSEGATVQHLAVLLDGADCEVPNGADRQTVTEEALPAVLGDLLHKLHHNQIILFPVGRWRSIFDVVAFSLAGNEEWQQVDAAATVELNTRDPLLSEAGDLHLVCDLVKVLFHDSESPDQGLILITAGLPLVMEIVPNGGVRLSFGNEAVAEEISEAITT